MKAVDSTIKIGGIVVAHSDDRIHELEQHGAAGGVRHGRHGLRVGALVRGDGLNTPPDGAGGRASRRCSTRARAALGTASYGCPGGANMPIAITEWGPNTIGTNVVIPMSTATAAPAGSQIAGLFAAESYALLHGAGRDGGALARAAQQQLPRRHRRHQRSVHDGATTRRAGATTARRSRTSWRAAATRWCRRRRRATVRRGAQGARVRPRERRHRGHDDQHQPQQRRERDAEHHAAGRLACVGKRYAYTPVNTDQDGGLTGDWIFSNTAGTSVPVLVPRVLVGRRRVPEAVARRRRRRAARLNFGCSPAPGSR